MTLITECSKDKNLPALILTKPQWPSDVFKERLIEQPFYGTKVYLSYAPDYIPKLEIRIYDYLPPHQLQVLNRHYKNIAMLHIQRDKRLKALLNLAQMLEIENNPIMAAKDNCIDLD